jgi:hypothetical protein
MVPQTRTENDKYSGSRTAQIQRGQGTIGLERLAQCLSTYIANLVVCDRTHSASRHGSHNYSTSTHHHKSQPELQWSRTAKTQRRQSVVGLEHFGQCLSTRSANLVSCDPLTQHGIAITTTAR